MLLIDEADPAILKERALSVSQLRTFVRCPRSFELQYLSHPRIPVREMGASVWFGKVIQQIIQRGYHELPLLEGHLQVWQQECGPILDDLQDWYALDVAYRESGPANSNARKRWVEENPAYNRLEEKIDHYQREHLAEWVWPKKYPLAGYYRWSTNFALNTPMTQLLLAHAVLVEGLLVRWPGGDIIHRFDDGGRGREQYKLLHGIIGGAHVVGVPDQFGIDPDGTAWISDNKVTAVHLTREELGEDIQLAAYFVLLKQNGWIEEGQRVRIGHCYISEGSLPQHEWSDTSLYDAFVLPHLHEQFALLKAAIQDQQFRRVRGIQPAAMSPCRFCGVRHACLQPVEAIG